MRGAHTRLSAVLSTAIAITFFTLSLTSCTNGADTAPHKGETTTTVSADTAPIDAQTPATFNPKDPNFRLFDPCTELDDEVFKKAGLGKRSGFGNWPGADFRICTFTTGEDSEYFGSVSVIMNSVNKETVRRTQHLFSESVESEIPGVYQYRLDAESVHECTSTSQTRMGQFEIKVNDLDKKLSDNEVCDQSLAFLENLYPEVEKKIGNGTYRN
ncbi:DUF3558 domain-containing protein [Corynebacterium hindlerae]|uniref:DUF3558 family protein n=1 Tax=Corynebacterium hindlerae TaxID=699041 RepID=UPI001AD63742|nr:DUF3558 family protein [Corynebacterium hindlerae]QTH60445.1 DUF3558 domain-containing protein [Corynebacterium hindlerae]